MGGGEGSRAFTDDEINNMLPGEFHTKNGIPTDPDTHSLLYVSRNRAIIVQVVTLISGVGAGLILGYYQHGTSPPWFMVILAIALMLTALISPVILD